MTDPEPHWTDHLCLLLACAWAGYLVARVIAGEEIVRDAETGLDFSLGFGDGSGPS